MKPELTKSQKKFLKVYNNIEQYTDLVDVAIKLGIAVQTVKNKAALLRKVEGVHLASRAQIPMSENRAKFMESWTAQDCIEELQRIASLDEERVVSRNYFRVNSKISESTWNRYFGTFEEYKRQSGVKLTRQQHAMERHIAIHASRDGYRDMTRDKRSYEGAYLRNRTGRFQSALVGSDFHDVEIDPFMLRVFLDAAKRVQPELIVLGGDIFDLAEFGRWQTDPREWDIVGRIKFVHEHILGPLRRACPDAQIDFIEGNHEARLLRLLSDATPALRAILSDIHGWTVSKLLGLDEFQINYIARADLAAFTKLEQNKQLNNNYRIYWDSFLVHHFPHAKSFAMPGLNGHHHKHQVWPMYNPVFGSYEWHQLGGGHRRSASYCEGEKWQNGFCIVNVDTHNRKTLFDYVPITDYAICGGQWYHRNEAEQIHLPQVA